MKFIHSAFNDMGSRVDIRVILALICAVAITYWLLLPRQQMKGSSEKTVEGGLERATAGNLDESEAKEQSKLKKTENEMDEDDHSKEKMVALEENLGHSLKRVEELENMVAKKNEEVEKMQQMAKDRGVKIDELQAKCKQQDGQIRDGEKKIKFKSFAGHRLIHLDLKGAAPKMSYLKELLTFIKGHGATGLLVEYEDMYPYEGELSVLRCKDAYTKAQVIEFVAMAKELNLIIMPLVQTFGHLEFVLKHKKFAHLRETKLVTNSLCPLKAGSLELAKSLVKDTLRLHPDASWVHLGGDEVWNLKSCSKCKASEKSAAEIYLHHMLPLLEFVKEETNGKATPIIWDDMMRSWSVKDLKAIAKLAQPMIWAYVPDLEFYYKFPEGMWERFLEAFPKIWIASSFKGVTKPSTNYVPINNHIQNHLSWMKIISEFPSKVDGIALTGWSRFDHYGPLCELLPVGIPSMTFCLAVLKTGNFNRDLQKTVSDQLGFPKPLSIDITNFKSYKIQNGEFLGSDVFEIVSEFEKANGWFLSGKVREEGWARSYHLKHGNLGYYQLNTTLNAANVCMELLQKLKPNAQNVLSKYFSSRIVEEWIEDKIVARIIEAGVMKTNVEKLIKKITHVKS